MQYLKRRGGTHKSEQKTLIELRNNDQDVGQLKDKTALLKHVYDEGHTFDIDNIKIIDKEKCYTKRLFLEMVHIKNRPNSVNLKSDVDGLNRVYYNLLTAINENSK